MYRVVNDIHLCLLPVAKRRLIRSSSVMQVILSPSSCKLHSPPLNLGDHLAGLQKSLLCKSTVKIALLSPYSQTMHYALCNEN